MAKYSPRVTDLTDRDIRGKEFAQKRELLHGRYLGKRSTMSCPRSILIGDIDRTNYCARRRYRQNSLLETVSLMSRCLRQRLMWPLLI
jgi:hypothetical protein